MALREELGGVQTNTLTNSYRQAIRCKYRTVGVSGGVQSSRISISVAPPPPQPEMLTTWDAAICKTAWFAGLVDTCTNCTAFAALTRVKENEKTHLRDRSITFQSVRNMGSLSTSFGPPSP